MPQLKLTYFDAPGRAEPIRIALRMSGLPFEDNRLAFPAFAAAKASGALPLGSVPVLEIDGQTFVQTGALLRWVARVGSPGLFPTDPAAALRVDSALDSLNDTLSHAIVPTLFERDPVKRAELRAAVLAGPLTRVYTYIEGLLEYGGTVFLGGTTPSIADLVLALQVEQIRSGGLDGITGGDLKKWTRVGALADATLAHPAVVAAR
jgi:glutathione S-transferase